MRFLVLIRAAFALLAAIVLSTPAEALLFRAYVSSMGSDANSCTLPQPCRLLPAALNAVADGGGIWILDSANYNTATVTIDKSVSILAVPGSVGSILAISGPSVSVSASGLKVALRNVVIAPSSGGGGTDGVSVSGTSTVTIEGSLIESVPGNGITVSNGGIVKVANATIRNVGLFAVLVSGGGSAEISRTQMLQNTDGGVSVTSATALTTTASVTDSTISGGLFGVSTYTAASGALSRATVARNTIESVQYGLDCETNGSGGTASMTISSNVVADSNYAWLLYNTGAVIYTLGNNHITNDNLTQGSLSTIAMH